MSITVAKFGGSSLKDNECLFKAAAAIKNEVDHNKKVVVVVSARGKTTDFLIKSAKEICPSYSIPPRELDSLLATGEQMSAAMFALALRELSVNAVSLTGEKAGILTNSNSGSAEILNIDTTRITDLLNQGFVVVVAGFQGADKNGKITTLGRGGSDTTAAALAVKLSAGECLIYTDVNGIYTADPRVIEKAKKYDSVSFDIMVEFAGLGARVLSHDSTKIAAENKLNLFVLSPLGRDSKTKLSEQTLPRYSDIVGVTLKTANSRSVISAVCAESGKAEYYANRAIHALSDNGIVCMDSEIKNLSFSITVAEVVSKNALKILHNLFFE